VSAVVVLAKGRMSGGKCPVTAFPAGRLDCDNGFAGAAFQRSDGIDAAAAAPRGHVDTLRGHVRARRRQKRPRAPRYCDDPAARPPYLTLYPFSMLRDLESKYSCHGQLPLPANVPPHKYPFTNVCPWKSRPAHGDTGNISRDCCKL